MRYTPGELAPGMVLIHRDQTLTIERAIFRRGRGLELHTRRPDGYLGPVVFPHPDETVAVASGTPPEVPWFNTYDHPHAEHI